MEGDDLDNFIYKIYKERTNEQDLEIRRKLVEVSSSREKKILRIQKQQEKQKPDGLLKKREVKMFKWGSSQETQTSYCV